MDGSRAAGYREAVNQATLPQEHRGPLTASQPRRVAVKYAAHEFGQILI
jgi:hypothetical protein